MLVPGTRSLTDKGFATKTWVFGGGGGEEGVYSLLGGAGGGRRGKRRESAEEEETGQKQSVLWLLERMALLPRLGGGPLRHQDVEYKRGRSRVSPGMGVGFPLAFAWPCFGRIVTGLAG